MLQQPVGRYIFWGHLNQLHPQECPSPCRALPFLRTPVALSVGIGRCWVVPDHWLQVLGPWCDWLPSGVWPRQRTRSTKRTRRELVAVKSNADSCWVRWINLLPSGSSGRACSVIWSRSPLLMPCFCCPIWASKKSTTLMKRTYFTWISRIALPPMSCDAVREILTWGYILCCATFVGSWCNVVCSLCGTVSHKGLDIGNNTVVHAMVSDSSLFLVWNC